MKRNFKEEAEGKVGCYLGEAIEGSAEAISRPRNSSIF